jgi:tRNA 2-thiouridine synthesizing protein A
VYGEAVDVLDARGLRWPPLPVLRARERLAGLRPGTVLELLADDPLVTLDVPRFLRSRRA